MNINAVVLTVNKCFFVVLHNTTECTTLNSDLSLSTIFHHHWYWYLIWHRRGNYGTWISHADFVMFLFLFFCSNLIFSTEALNKTVHWQRKQAFWVWSYVFIYCIQKWTILNSWLEFMCFQIELSIIWRKLYKTSPSASSKLLSELWILIIQAHKVNSSVVRYDVIPT